MLSKESEFFNVVAKAVIDHVQTALKGSNDVVAQKGRDTNYATAIDVSVEELIVAEIRKQFPDDEILAEEGLSDTSVTDKRIWIIDPICGTNNLGRGISAFCTNIALAENRSVIASCVIDLSEGEYYWSVGKEKVYKGSELFTAPKQDKGILVDVDLGCIPNLSADQKARYTRMLQDILTTKDYMLNSLNSSLGFMYVAIGRVNGFFWMYTHPWDFCAGAFLIEQLGGIVTNLDGNPLTIAHGTNLVATMDKDLHEVLVQAYKDAA